MIVVSRIRSGSEADMSDTRRIEGTPVSSLTTRAHSLLARAERMATRFSAIVEDRVAICLSCRINEWALVGGDLTGVAYVSCM